MAYRILSSYVGVGYLVNLLLAALEIILWMSRDTIQQDKFLGRSLRAVCWILRCAYGGGALSALLHGTLSPRFWDNPDWGWTDSDNPENFAWILANELFDFLPTVINAVVVCKVPGLDVPGPDLNPLWTGWFRNVTNDKANDFEWDADDSTNYVAHVLLALFGLFAGLMLGACCQCCKDEDTTTAKGRSRKAPRYEKVDHQWA